MPVQSNLVALVGPHRLALTRHRAVCTFGAVHAK
jgi:hypothetical protein